MNQKEERSLVEGRMRTPTDGEKEVSRRVNNEVVSPPGIGGILCRGS